MKILIIDDEDVLQDVLTSLLRKEGYSTLSARSGEEGLEILQREQVDLVLLDLMLPGISGKEVLEKIRHSYPEQVIIVITAFSSIEGAIEAMRRGAFHYIPKPFKNAEVLLTIQSALEKRQLADENRNLRAQLRDRYAFDNILGKSKPMTQVFDMIQLAAPAKSNILILGESGTGKELVAKAIHSNSRRSNGPFITVNSGSMPPDLLESNLFGHIKGAFTGAVSSKQGLFEMANGGSIFFDEIGNIPVDTQAKLLRVMQEKEFMRLGATETLTADVRIIAATNVDLDVEVKNKTFREDLFYRLNVITINLPPLRDRSEDVIILVQHFLTLYAEENEKRLQAVSPDAMELLVGYAWPGNVRELENVIERAVVLSTGDLLGVDLLPPVVRQPQTIMTLPASLDLNGASFKEAVSSYERKLIVRALENSGGVQKSAATLLQVKPTTLHEMMKRLDISVDRIAS